MSKLVRDHFDITETRDHPRRFWNKDMTRYYKCRKCSWVTATGTKAHGGMSGLLTSYRVSMELGSHYDSHKKKAKK